MQFKKCFLEPPSLVRRYQQNPINPYQHVINQLRTQSNIHEQYLNKIAKQKRTSETREQHDTSEKKKNNVQKRINWNAWDKITQQTTDEKLDLNFEGKKELNIDNSVSEYDITK
jgi:hypothetical protein